MADKPSRFPWENEPFVDHRAATQKAIAAAQRPPVDLNSPAMRAYVQKALNDETEALRTAPKRNNQLFKSAANLFELVAAGVLDEETVVDTLHDACLANKSIQDDGERQFERSLKSGRRKGLDKPRDLSHVGNKTNGFVFNDEPVKVVHLDEINSLERGFWTSRESLQTIYLAALSGMCAPWAVLGHCAARALALVRPNCRLPPIIGGQSGGSLNWFCAITAKSGGGKDSAMSIAEDLIRQDILTRNLGSGEGMIDAYVKPANKELGEPQSLHDSVMFVADEIDTMAVLTQRSGATMSSILRSGFSGGTLGFSYRTASSLHLPKHSYRMTLVVSVQPAKAGALMDDTYGGTLQRFMWFPGSDWRITSEPPSMPAKLELPSPVAWQFPRELQIPYEAVELIRDERVRINVGDADDIDGHALYIREKFAYALTVLDGRSDGITEDDWRLAGIASRVSDHTRKWVKSELIRIQEEQATEKGRLRGVEYVATDEEKSVRTSRQTDTVANRIWRKIKESGDRGVTKKELNSITDGSERHYLRAAINKLSDGGFIEKMEVKYGERWRLTDD